MKIRFLDSTVLVCLAYSAVAFAQSLQISPAAVTVTTEGTAALTSTQEAVWQATGGKVSPDRGRVVTYRAPALPGRYTITALSTQNSAVRALAVVTVLAAERTYLSPIYAGDGYSMVVAEDGTLWGWGEGKPVPFMFDNASNISGIYESQAVAGRDGTVYRYSFGSLERIGSSRSASLPVESDSTERVIYLGQDGKLYAVSRGMNG